MQDDNRIRVLTAVHIGRIVCSRMTNSVQMGRPKIRTATLSTTTCDALIDAFGTVWNAYRQLALTESGVSYPVFARSLRGETIAPETLAAVLLAWELRRRQPVDPTVAP